LLRLLADNAMSILIAQHACGSGFARWITSRMRMLLLDELLSAA
jgi:hypothetical protein